MSEKCLKRWPFFRAFSGGLITAFALHCAAWLWSVDHLSNLIEQNVNNLRSQGWRVEIAAARYGGWPGRARVEVGPATIAAHGLSVRAESLTAEAALVRSGPLTWRSRGHAYRFDSGQERPVLAGDVAGEALPDGVVLTTAAMRVAGLLEAEALRVQIRPNDTRITVQRLRPLDVRWALGPSIEALDMRVEGLSPKSSAVVSHVSAAPPQTEGDHFKLELVHSAVAGMDATGRAELWFDAALRPRLVGIIRVAGYAAGLDGLVAAGVVPSRAAVAAKAVLGLLATPPDGIAEIPVRIEGGIFYAAQFALLRLIGPEEPDLRPLR